MRLPLVSQTLRCAFSSATCRVHRTERRLVIALFESALRKRDDPVRATRSDLMALSRRSLHAEGMLAKLSTNIEAQHNSAVTGWIARRCGTG